MAEQSHAGWAQGEHEPLVGPFVADMIPPRGVLVSDMPSEKPAYRPPPKVKGVPGASASVDEDHKPGGGTWRDV